MLNIPLHEKGGVIYIMIEIAGGLLGREVVMVIMYAQLKFDRRARLPLKHFLSPTPKFFT